MPTFKLILTPKEAVELLSMCNAAIANEEVMLKYFDDEDMVSRINESIEEMKTVKVKVRNAIVGRSSDEEDDTCGCCHEYTRTEYTFKPNGDFSPGRRRVGVCYGTRERDECSCGGDKTKCDFYPEKRTPRGKFE